MDRFLYLAMNGAKNALHAQQTNANNLANASTVGFKSQLDHFQSEAVYGPGHATRAYASDMNSGVDFKHGPVMTTGRELDVTINGEGWFAVQAADGSQAYTRRGDFKTDPTGLLLNGSDQIVMGEGGPITIPDFESLVIGRDGTISIRAKGQAANALVVVDRLKMVKPEQSNLERGSDGLFRTRDGNEAPLDATVTLTNGALEASNVNTVDAMVKMMEYARFYETQVKLMSVAEENDASSSRLMRLSG
ncbi:MAG: flagellar basal-body rod protein FlgF [Gammaproteobacteria bacterium]|jgi:flagellar basal-body rod protein FlgF|nr:flagellar basal-body rod protein FlgF [Gammaproteobacteria bacterium]MBT3725418.1 flagellar basal-body rod protein FlgF [Gammaproteobacteria bacterium]MBT4196511.1 flagellar basal-body rod protein FlgF [Gammaproteobacteria bacterium]MBT4450197.1 flagellar basal-body rod protein FlgF [Gammaproteobacteria bacterium]MBT4861668.1 flagellar basal-body rod protein FlgF [Gammaproteobacteria bacterium]